MILNIFYLNFPYRNQLLIEYAMNMDKFLEQRYLVERYGLNWEVHSMWPGGFVPDTYDELRTFDLTGWPSQLENTHQLYACYGIDFNPHGEDKGGWCEAVKGPLIRPQDMMFVEMDKYFPSLVVRSIYHFYASFSRLLTHELDHRALAWLNNDRWKDAVHSVPQLPEVEWHMGTKDSLGNDVVFYSQQDPKDH